MQVLCNYYGVKKACFVWREEEEEDEEEEEEEKSLIKDLKRHARLLKCFFLTDQQVRSAGNAWCVPIYLVYWRCAPIYTVYSRCIPVVSSWLLLVTYACPMVWGQTGREELREGEGKTGPAGQRMTDCPSIF